jgi:hypothetical protein
VFSGEVRDDGVTQAVNQLSTGGVYDRQWHVQKPNQAEAEQHHESDIAKTTSGEDGAAVVDCVIADRVGFVQVVVRLGLAL